MKLNARILKHIAVASMIVDHAATAVVYRVLYTRAIQSSSPYAVHVYHVYDGMRIFGRLAFPIICFLLVEGFFHTRHIRRYIVRLLLFALLSEIPFNLCLYDKWLYNAHQNVLFTLFIGLLVMCGCSYARESLHERPFLGALLQISCIAAGATFAFLCKCDYQWYGVLMIICFYYLRAFPIWYSLLAMLAIGWREFEWPAIFAFPFLLLYNGEKGKQNKYIYYAIYPLHLFILWMISKIMLSWL